MRSVASRPTGGREGGGRKPFRGRELPMLLGVLVLAFLAGGALALLYLGQGDGPGENSAEAGFARDMAVHHAQAVQMAGIIQGRTESEEIRTLATDIILTQQNQIGQMQGWLNVWGLPQTGSEPPMSWMGHPTEGLMPGMATPEEINALETLPPDEADEQFLRLMIPHHEAAVPMSEAVLAETDRPEVEQLARAIAASQQGEISLMQDLLERRGASPIENEPSPAHDHGEHGDR